MGPSVSRKLSDLLEHFRSFAETATRGRRLQKTGITPEVLRRQEQTCGLQSSSVVSTKCTSCSSVCSSVCSPVCSSVCTSVCTSSLIFCQLQLLARRRDIVAYLGIAECWGSTSTSTSEVHFERSVVPLRFMHVCHSYGLAWLDLVYSRRVVMLS